VLFAVCATVLFMVAALVVDLGLARDTRRESQNASDASALAAANVLYLDGTGKPNLPAAVTAAEQYAAINMGTTAADWNSCVDSGRPAGYYVVPGTTPCISFDEALAPSHVRVKLPTRVVRTGLGVVAGVQEIPIDSMAQADVDTGNKAKCGVCILGSDPQHPHDLQNGDMKVTNANVRANGNVNVQSNGGLTVTGGSIGIQGTATGTNYYPAVATNQPPIADPLATWAPPALPSNTSGSKTDPCTQGPGLYGSVNFTDSAVCTLQPGLYSITGTWSISGQGSIDATAGVTLYFTCSTKGTGQTPDTPRACSTSGEDGGKLDASGQGGIAIQAPASGDTKGISIMYDRNNTSPLVYTGQGSLRSTSGTIYATRAEFRFNGNGTGQMMDTLIIVNNLGFNGNPSTLNTTYTPEKNAYIPPQELALSQ
jgi:hypothetical protein